MRNTSALDLTRSVPPTVGCLAQDAEVAFPVGHLGGVVEGVGLAVGERSDFPGTFEGAAYLDDYTLRVALSPSAGILTIRAKVDG